mgnify:CR=1 FL=1
MSQSEYAIWLPHCTKEFAKEKAQAMAISQDEALKLSEQSFKSILPEGLNTPDSYLFSILNGDDQKIGTVWFVISTKWGVTTAFIYDLEIAANFRRLGHAQVAMRLIEPVASELGATKLALHVFGFNSGAIGLYESLGYKTTDINMAKSL